MRVNRVAEQPGFPHSVGEVPGACPGLDPGAMGHKAKQQQGDARNPVIPASQRHPCKPTSFLQANVIPASQRHSRKQTSSLQANVIPANAGIQGCGEAGQQTRAAQRNNSHPN